MPSIQEVGEVVLQQREPQPTLAIRAPAMVAQLGEAMGERLRLLAAFLRERDLRPSGSPFVRYHSFGEAEADFELGVPVAGPVPGDGGTVVSGTLPGGATITTWHHGAHDTLGVAYGRIEAWLSEHNRDRGGPAWEVYNWINPDQLDDLAAWPEPAPWHTQLVQPLA